MMRTRWLFLFVIALLVIVGSLLTWHAAQRADREMREDLLLQAQLLAQTISVDRIIALNAAEGDHSSPVYQQLEEQLSVARQTIDKCRLLYLLTRKADGTLAVQLESDCDGSRGSIPPGHPQGDSAVAFDIQDAVVKGPVSDAGGSRVTVLVPITDSKTAESNHANPSDALSLVRKSIAYYRKFGREHLVRALSDRQGEFCKGDLYAFVFDRSMALLAHPMRPEMVGHNLLDRKDWAGGKHLTREIQSLAETEGSGWIDYEYENPLSKQLDRKTTYVERVDDLIICAGAYKGAAAIIAVLGVDMDADAWKWEMVRGALPSALLTLAFLAILLTAVVLPTRDPESCPVPSRRMWRIEPVVTVVIGVTLTLFAGWTANRTESRNHFESFMKLGASKTDGFVNAMLTLRDIQLEGLANYYIGSDDVTWKEFHQYTDYLARSPIVQAWGWVPAVSAADKSRIEQEARAAGFPGFDVWQKDAQGKRVPASGRDTYYPLMALTPLISNQGVLGYDLGSESRRSAALREAARTGLMSATDPIDLVQEASSQKAILVYRPVYFNDQPHRLRGFALAAVRGGTLLRTASPDRSVFIALSMLSKDGSSEMLGTSYDADSLFSPRFSANRPVLAFGKVFSVTTHSGPEFDRIHPVRAGWLTLMEGLLLTLALTLVIGGIVRRREKLERMVAQRTADLQESKSRFNQLAEQSRTVNWEIDPDGLYTYVSHVAQQVFGYRPDELVGRMRFGDLHPETEREAFKAAALEIFQRKAEFVGLRKAVVTKDGSLLWVSSNGIPRFDDEGNLCGYRGCDIDVTEQDRTQRELKETIDALQAANKALGEFNQIVESATRAKSEFLANMSHEIRTPMTAILGFAEVLLSDLSIAHASPEHIEAIRTIQRNGEYLLGLINGILDLSKIEAGKLEIASVRCSPMQVLAEVIALMRIRAEAKNLPLTLECIGSIPDSIQSDPLRLRQILINIVGNAIKFTETGSVRVVVTLVRKEGASSLLQIGVIDTGIGLASDQISKLFKPFSQADSSATRKSGGTGLGLTISKRLAEMLGGDIAIQSELAKGSTFTVTVETGSLDGVTFVGAPALTTTCAPLVATSEVGASISLDVRILLAEDGPDNQRLITFLLKKAGAQVILAENGQVACEEALAAQARGEPFHVILMDMQMPVLDGYDAARRLRAAGYTGSIVALTAHAMADDRQKCLDAGCNDYATKPVDRPNLLATIAHWANHAAVGRT